MIDFPPQLMLQVICMLRILVITKFEKLPLQAW